MNPCPMCNIYIEAATLVIAFVEIRSLASPPVFNGPRFDLS
jgi:hypothetical protein